MGSAYMQTSAEAGKSILRYFTTDIRIWGFSTTILWKHFQVLVSNCSPEIRRVLPMNIISVEVWAMGTRMLPGEYAVCGLHGCGTVTVIQLPLDTATAGATSGFLARNTYNWHVAPVSCHQVSYYTKLSTAQPLAPGLCPVSLENL